MLLHGLVLFVSVHLFIEIDKGDMQLVLYIGKLLQHLATPPKSRVTSRERHLESESGSRLFLVMKSDDIHQCHCGFEFMNKVCIFQNASSYLQSIPF